ncbi:MAG: transporter substrate-binding domain-containing protein [Pseudomonadota bacterium]
MAVLKSNPQGRWFLRLLLSGLLGLAFFFSIETTWSADDKVRFVTLEFAPFIYGKNQQVAGPGRDLIEAVCDEAGIDCSFDIYPWRRAQELMKKGEADGMMVIGRNPKREEWIRFSPPHFRTEYGIFVESKDILDFINIAQLEGLRIGVFAPSNTAVQLEDIRDEMIAQGLDPIEIEERPDDASGFRKLAAGRIDAVYSNRDRGRQILEIEGLTDKVRYAGGHQGILYYAGFTRSFPNQELVDRFDAAWLELFRRGEAQKIIKSYGLEPADVE